MNALKAKEFYRRDVQYIVRNGKALIINEVTTCGSSCRILLSCCPLPLSVLPNSISRDFVYVKCF